MPSNDQNISKTSRTSHDEKESLSRSELSRSSHSSSNLYEGGNSSHGD